MHPKWETRLKNNAARDASDRRRRVIDSYRRETEELKARLEQYESIGTPEECAAVMEKTKGKDPYAIGQGHEADIYCPTCSHHLGSDQDWAFGQTPYCPWCGQKLGSY